MNEPTIVTIPKVSDAIPDVGQLKVGDELEIQAKVTAIDEQGVSIQVVSGAKSEPEPEAPEGGEGDEAVLPGDENPQADFVASKKKAMAGA